MSGDDLRFEMELQNEGTPYVTVTLVEREGSVPCDVGGRMIVTEAGRQHGTVGGGRIEASATDHALTMLRNGPECDLVQWNLNTDLGMTCGGRVRFFFQRASVDGWRICIFGAGHVCQALTRVLAPLPCRVTVVDPRTDWLKQLPPAIHVIQSGVTSELIRNLPDDTQVLSITRGHREDIEVLTEIARSGRRFTLVGVIGSRTKAGTLRRELRERGIDAEQIEFECPIGLSIGGNHPGEIAISIAARLLQNRDQAKGRRND